MLILQEGSDQNTPCNEYVIAVRKSKSDLLL
jgi:hypothetical protein